MPEEQRPRAYADDSLRDSSTSYFDFPSEHFKNVTQHFAEFSTVVANMQQLADSWNKQLFRIFERISSSVGDSFTATFDHWSQRWARAHAIVCAELPKRGWYLTGQEPAALLEELATAIEADDWTSVDGILLRQASELQIKNDLFQQWLAQHGVPSCCTERVRLVLEHREAGSHEVATIVGMTVIDELCRNLYGGRDFTTKRGRQPKPQVACATAASVRQLSSFAKGFSETFGMIHENTDSKRLEDEDYFNRAAIVHGQMNRQYGPKDSAKVFMLLMLLVFGLDDEKLSESPQ